MSPFIHHAYFASKLILDLVYKGGRKKMFIKEYLGLHVDIMWRMSKYFLPEHVLDFTRIL